MEERRKKIFKGKKENKYVRERKVCQGKKERKN